MVSGDQEMIDFAHKGFQYGMRHGDTLIGYFPENIDTPQLEHSEICEVAYMIMLALKLTEAGVGDYWDEADRWTRNMLAEGQLLRTDWIERIPGAGLKWERQSDIPRSVIDETYQTTERVAERNLGAFAGWPTANDWYVGAGPGIMHCCTYRGSRVIYFLWDRILQHDNGKLRVNLLLNRASPWADVDSHIPYVGQVDVRIKQPVELWLRIPEWVQPAEAAGAGERCRTDRELGGAVRQSRGGEAGRCGDADLPDRRAGRDGVHREGAIHAGTEGERGGRD